MKALRLLSLLCVLPACSSVQIPDVASVITPYRIDIRQGNYISQEMIAQLKPGMTRDQVRFVLGTPLVADLFHKDRWDYVYSFKPGHGESQLRHFAVYFEEDRLARLSGDVIGAEPGEAEADAAEAAKARSRVIEIEAADAPKKEGKNPEEGAQSADEDNVRGASDDSDGPGASAPAATDAEPRP